MSKLDWNINVKNDLRAVPGFRPARALNSSPLLLKYVDNNKINYTYQRFLANFPQKKQQQTNKQKPNASFKKQQSGI